MARRGGITQKINGMGQAKRQQDDHKICFITVVKHDDQYALCQTAIAELKVPADMVIDSIAIRDADSMAEAYNAAMKASDARYKIYLQDNLIILDKDFLNMLVDMFKAHPEIGIAGAVGSSDLPKDGMYWDGSLVGAYYSQVSADEQVIAYTYSKDPEVPVNAMWLDGCILCTQYDIPWREDLFKGSNYYDLSQCMEFHRKGYQSAVFPGLKPSVLYFGQRAPLGEKFAKDNFTFRREYLFSENEDKLYAWDDSSHYRHMAEKLECKNSKQAYLCWQNALFYEKDPEQKKVIQQQLDTLEKNGQAVPKTAIVILNYQKADMTLQCLDSIRTTCAPDSYQIIVVDNGSNDDSVQKFSQEKDILLIANDSNHGFPGGCNDGIRAAEGDSDILLLNNDTLMTPNGLFTLRMALYEDASTGSAGAMTNCASNNQIITIPFGNAGSYIEHAKIFNQYEPSAHEKRIYLVGFALLLRRDALNKVGLLDERFNPGNYEDNDIGLRMLQHGYHNILCHDCFIVHFGSQSFRKDISKYNKLLETNREKLNQKYGHDMSYYSFPRTEVISLMKGIVEDEGRPFAVLEVGCGLGATLNRIKWQYPNASTMGIELVEDIAQLGATNTKIIPGDIETMQPDIGPHSQDVIIFADVIEHLRDPLKTLEKMKNYLKNDGYLLMSIPNIMHYSVIIPLLMGEYSWDPAGIRDYTHMHCFTLNTIRTMLQSTGYEIESIISKQVETPYYRQEQFNWFWKMLDAQKENVADLSQFQTYQYLVRARLSK
jgi:GT2 family glycosyltransferase